MTKILSKLTISNSVNDDTYIEWGTFETEESMQLWKKEKEIEQNEWNYHTSGAMSYRHYDFSVYNADNILNMSMDEFNGMSLKLFIEIINNI